MHVVLSLINVWNVLMKTLALFAMSQINSSWIPSTTQINVSFAMLPLLDVLTAQTFHIVLSAMKVKNSSKTEIFAGNAKWTDAHNARLFNNAKFVKLAFISAHLLVQHAFKFMKTVQSVHMMFLNHNQNVLFAVLECIWTPQKTNVFSAKCLLLDVPNAKLMAMNVLNVIHQIIGNCSMGYVFVKANIFKTTQNVFCVKVS